MDKINEKRKRTIKVRITKKRQEFLEQIKKTPIVQIACEKSGISRATIYRWREARKEFAEAMDKALQEGKFLVNDVAESQLMASIRERNMAAIIFWLKHHHKEYVPKIKIDAQINHITETLTPEQEALVREALRLASLGLVNAQQENEQQNDNPAGTGGDDGKRPESPDSDN